MFDSAMTLLRLRAPVPQSRRNNESGISDIASAAIGRI